MIMQVYSIFDVAAGAYARPFFVQTDGQAMRAFGDLVKDTSNDVGKHPEDYTLFRIGSYNDSKGLLSGETPEALATGLEMVAASDPKKIASVN